MVGATAVERNLKVARQRGGRTRDLHQVCTGGDLTGEGCKADAGGAQIVARNLRERKIIKYELEEVKGGLQPSPRFYREKSTAPTGGHLGGNMQFRDYYKGPSGRNAVAGDECVTRGADFVRGGAMINLYGKRKRSWLGQSKKKEGATRPPTERKKSQ